MHTGAGVRLARTDGAPENRRGGEREASVNALRAPFRIRRKVCVGGRYFCAPDYYLRHCPAAGQRQDVDTGMSHGGFRCIVRR